MNITRSAARPVLSLFAALLLTGAAAVPARAADAAADVYLLNPGDVLIVSVWKEPDLQAEVFIRPDGSLSFPLAGELSASRRTVEQLRTEIETRIRKLVPDAVVNVVLKSIAGNRIYVVGNVARQGSFTMNGPTDVMQALSLAGGTTTYADLNDIRILRRESGRLVSLEFRYKDVERGNRLEQNVLLRSGDTVVVP